MGRILYMKDVDLNHTVSKQWYSEINILRGLLVVLVVLGHITQINYDDSTVNNINLILNSFIYSFHMPAFFMISGFLGYHALKPSQKEDNIKDIVEFTKNKFRRLLVPYFAMGIIYLPFRLLFSSIARIDYTVSNAWQILIGYNPDGALWFLYALFVISLLVRIFVKRENLYSAFFIGCLIYIGNTFISWQSDHEILDRIFQYACFYLLGIICRYKYDDILKLIKKPIIITITGILFFVINIVLLNFNIGWVRLFTSITGTILLFSFSLFLAQHYGIINRLFNTLGDYGMDIYIFSEPIKVIFRTLLKKTDIPSFVIEILLLVIVISAAYCLSKFIVRKIKPMRVILLGMKS